MAVVCSTCGHDNPHGVLVCSKCASPLANLCPNCNFENPKGFKFCGNCGANLLTAALLHASDVDTLRRLQGYVPPTLVDKILRVGKQIEGERRTVTVLFSDIVGFTSISERLDPEQVYTIIDACVAAFRDHIYEHEGTLDKFMGDGVMALFGAPVAHEDDPVRAVRCALGMQQAINVIGEGLVATHGVRLQIRIGLNLGTVIVGDIRSDLRMNYTALGDTVNVAARLQAVAEPGAILTSRSVYERTQALFEYEEEGAIHVKGRVEPVEIYRLLGPLRKPSRIRGIPGLAAPMVGREKELALVKVVADDLVTKGRGTVLLLSGDPGVGKSRLVAELRDHLAGLALSSCEAGCAPYGQSAYDLVVRLLEACLHIMPDDDEGVKRGKIEHGVRSVLPPGQPLTDILPYVENLLSVPIVEKELAEPIRNLEPSQLRQQTFLAVRDLIVAQALDKPLFIILEDLHWIDKMSLGLLFFLFNAIDSVPLVLLCTSRPVENQIAVQIETAGLATLGDKFIHVPLHPLSLVDSAALVDLLLTAARMPESLRHTIPERAEGNPFYLEEIIRMLIDRHIIIRVGDHWETSPSAESAQFQVPGTLEGLIMARVDSLTEASRKTLQTASVIGRGLTKALLTLSMNGDGARVGPALQELIDHELLLVRSETPEPQYEFRHVLTQLTVYNSLLTRRREETHHRVGEALEHLYASHLDEQTERVAFHYAQSKDGHRALPYLIKSAERASARFANEQALEYLGTAASMAEQANATPEQRIRILRGMGEAQEFVGDYEGSAANLRSALDLAQAERHTPEHGLRIAEIARRLGRVHERRGERGEAVRWLEYSLDELKVTSEGGYAAERARTWLDIGWLHYLQGNLEEAYQWDMRSLEICEGSDYYAEMGAAYNRLAALFVDKYDWGRATDFAVKGLMYREMVGDTEGIARSHSNLGVISAELCSWEQAISHFKRSLEIRQRIGQANGLCNAYTNLGRVYVLKGASKPAREYIGAALGLAQKIHDPDQICLALNALAETELVDHNWKGAIPLLEASLRTSAGLDYLDHKSQASRIMAEALLSAGEGEGAARSAHEALSIATETGNRQTEASALRVLGTIERTRENWREAEMSLSRSIGIFGEIGNKLDASRSEFELAMLYRDRGMNLNARALLERCCASFSSSGVEDYTRRAEQALASLGRELPHSG